MRRLLGLVLVSLLCLPNSSLSNGTRSNTSYSTRTSSSHTKSYCYSCSRDSSGSVKRSSQAKHDFMKLHPCPSTGKTSGPCQEYVVDHVQPLKRGGADNPSNMQWQTVEAAKVKDRIEQRPERPTVAPFRRVLARGIGVTSSLSGP